MLAATVKRKESKTMPLKKEKFRIIYETCLGKPVRACQWSELKTQLRSAQLPLTIENLRFVAKCKKVAPRKAIASEVLRLVVEAGANLGSEVEGAVIKSYVMKKCPKISTHKFYRAFRSAGIPYRNEQAYTISDLGEVFYKIFT